MFNPYFINPYFMLFREFRFFSFFFYFQMSRKFILCCREKGVRSLHPPGYATVMLVRLRTLFFAAYRTEEGKPWVLPVVREAEKRLANDMSQNHEYLPVLGYEPFCNVAVELALGKDSPAIKSKKVFVSEIVMWRFQHLRREREETKLEMDLCRETISYQ